jgi:hypothetical protein
METSRLKQAISSVQLFVQRCQMNLEPSVLVDDDEDSGWKQWYWRKNYRVWEANRKIFLYPENWIEPELRDDKSPFFRELESELLQDDLTAEHAERALLSYLYKLDEVAHLEVLAMKHEYEEHLVGKPTDILHVFARTPNQPHRYFYRQQVDSSIWTAWEALDLDIQGEHLIPVVWNRRLLLFWADFSVTRPESEGGKERWEIKLCWAERGNNGWGPKSISDLAIRLEKNNQVDLEREYQKEYEAHKKCVASAKSGTIEPASGEGESVSFKETVFCREPPTLTYWLTKESDLSFNAHIDSNNHLYIWLTFNPQDLFEEHLKREDFNNAFLFDGCRQNPQLNRVQCASSLPPGIIRNSQCYLAAPVEESKLYRVDLPARHEHYKTVLRPSRRFLVVPQSSYCDGSWDALAFHPFIYRDNKRSFFVTTDQEPIPPEQEALPKYKEPDPRIQPPIGQIVPEQFEQYVFPTYRYEHFVESFQHRDVAASLHANNLSEVPDTDSMQLLSLPLDTSDLKLLSAETAPALNGNVAIGTLLHKDCEAFCNTQAWIGLFRKSSLQQPMTRDLTRYKTVYRFSIFYHPHLCAFMRALKRCGVEGLCQPAVQVQPLYARQTSAVPMSVPLDFDAEYRPVLIYQMRDGAYYPSELRVNFDVDDSYSLYNWELFFHIPLLI